MRTFRVLLTALLGSVIVTSTCGVIEFLMYLVFLHFEKNYQTWLITFLVVDLCAIALLILVVHRFTAAAVAVAAGALFHSVIYGLHWTNRFQMFATGIATDTIIIMIMITAAYTSARRHGWASPGGAESRGATMREPPLTKPDGFWSSLDQPSKVAIVTSLITSFAGILTTIIGALLNPH